MKLKTILVACEFHTRSIPREFWKQQIDNSAQIVFKLFDIIISNEIIILTQSAEAVNFFLAVSTKFPVFLN